jgi:hypothetical protein
VHSEYGVAVGPLNEFDQDEDDVYSAMNCGITDAYQPREMHARNADVISSRDEVLYDAAVWGCLMIQY